ncbi:disulfide bond formation protein B [Wenxinia saemankumensis]|uniref:Disulfide bond formation protein DsbB n=1 Tax=Wenxinia saemankumensis TaxID=1447782 RepID=A0A1M6A1S0_9RHOB|nr:disulfide bond formation protein B [Wenxinia saemankumensis]SHI30378.1 Disulfide bond formation protein DsbB [Wenxinia saemankumensis]
MTRTALVALATIGSALLLGGAFLFQSFGWQPCQMCLWQRWPHAAAIVIGVAALASGMRALSLAGTLAAIVAAGLAIFHTGVERDWWQGPATCASSGPGVGGLSTGDLLAVDGPGLVQCDAFNAFFLGLSMANWNAIFSLILVGIWLAAWRAPE